MTKLILNFRPYVAFLALAQIFSYAHAAPMGFVDSTMTMFEASANWREANANYALTPRDAVGAGALWFRSDDKKQMRTLAELNYTRLLKRWNGPDSQANVWLFMGAGGLSGNDFSGNKLALQPGVQVDYETRRVYAALRLRGLRTVGSGTNLNHDYGAVVAGFSFYETDFDETQPWLIVEAKRMRGMNDKVEITPMLRLINKQFFVEVGANLNKQIRANLMVTF